MASKHRRTALLAGCGLAALAGAAPLSNAQAATTLFNSNGFEPTGTLTTSTFNANGTVVTAGYIPNQVLAGQSALNTSNAFLGVTGGTGAVPVIGVSTYQSTFGSNANPTNTQLAVAVDTNINASTGSVAEYYPNSNLGPLAYNTSIPSNGKVIDVVFTMSTTAAASGAPVFGVEAFTAGGAPVGELLVNTAVTGAGTTGTIIGSATTPTFAPTLGAGNFFSYELQLNYATQTTNLYEATPGSAAFTNLIGSSPFLSGSASAPLTTFSYAALTSFSLSGSTLANGFGLFDDYSVTATGVPEPTVASLAVGATALLASRRKRRVAGR